MEDDGEECVGGFVDEIEDGFLVDETVEQEAHEMGEDGHALGVRGHVCA